MFEVAPQLTPIDSIEQDDASRPLYRRHLPAGQNGSPHASPSLDRLRADGPRAFEFKFLLDPAQALEVEARLAAGLSLDPHADEANGNGYQVTTLYCDTPQWDVFHRQGRYRLFKLRLRRYGQAEHVFLERKAKRKN